MTDPNNIYNMNWVKYVPYTTGISKPVWLGGDTPTTGVRINTNTLDFKNYINFAGMTDANGVVSGVTMSLTFGQQDAEHNICAWTSCYTTTVSVGRIRLQTAGASSYDWIWPSSTIGNWYFQYAKDMGSYLNPMPFGAGCIVKTDKAVTFAADIRNGSFDSGTAIKIGAGSTVYRCNSSYTPDTI